MSSRFWSALGDGTGESLSRRIFSVVTIGGVLCVVEMQQPNPSWFTVFACTFFLGAMQLYFRDRDHKRARRRTAPEDDQDECCDGESATTDHG